MKLASTYTTWTMTSFFVDSTQSYDSGKQGKLLNNFISVQLNGQPFKRLTKCIYTNRGSTGQGRDIWTVSWGICCERRELHEFRRSNAAAEDGWYDVDKRKTAAFIAIYGMFASPSIDMLSKRTLENEARPWEAVVDDSILGEGIKMWQLDEEIDAHTQLDARQTNS